MDAVSCLMLTSDRLEWFKLSFACYCSQDYPAKELVIICSGSSEYQEAIRDLIKRSGRDDVKTIFPESRLPLGALRNLSVEHASGTFVCQWDDDDLSHPARLRLQLEAMQASAGIVSYLRDHFLLMAPEGRLYWCDWGRTPAPGMPASLLGLKCALPKYGASLRTYEDSLLQDEMARKGVRLATIGNLGHLFIYTYHGRNAYPYSHYKQLLRQLSLERATLKERVSEICTALDQYPISPPLSITDQMDQEVFVWQGQTPRIDRREEANVGIAGGARQALPAR